MRFRVLEFRVDVPWGAAAVTLASPAALGLYIYIYIYRDHIWVYFRASFFRGIRGVQIIAHMFN